MPSLGDLLPFLLLGLAGSLHCAGMCGAFAVCASVGPRGAGRAVAFGAYGLGKASTYAVLALAASLGVERLSAHLDAEAFGLLRRALAVLAGLLFVGVGLSLAGLRLRRRRPAPGGWFGRGLSRASCALDAVRGLSGWSGALGTGVLTGLLPCGLTLSMLALAAQAHRPTAVAGAVLFGLATLPALALVALGGYWLPASWRSRGARLVGPALVVAGLLTLARGAAPGDTPMCHAECAPEATSGAAAVDGPADTAPTASIGAPRPPAGPADRRQATDA